MMSKVAKHHLRAIVLRLRDERNLNVEQTKDEVGHVQEHGV
jgi:hypothetical protein